MIKGALLLMDHEVKDAHPDCTVAVELKIYKNEGLNIVLPMIYSLHNTKPRKLSLYSDSYLHQIDRILRAVFLHDFLAIVNEYKEIDYEIMPNLAHRSY